MWWILGAGVVIAALWLFAPSWRVLRRGYLTDERDAAAVFWAQHSSSHG